jgi:hypothetical protein
MAVIDDIESLATRINALREAEDLAAQAYPQMLPELRRLHYAALKSLRDLASKSLRGRPALGARGPHVSIELLERLFVVLRDQAEMEWTRALKLTGPEATRARKEADELARLAHTAAVALKIAAEATGRWSDEYASEHGLGTWL